MGDRGIFRMAAIGAALAAAIALAGCSSIPGLKTFSPGAKPAQVAAAKPAPKPVAKKSEDDSIFAVLSFAEEPRGPSDVNGLIAKYAAYYDLPASLVHRVVKKESGYNPRARNGPYWGLMQIRHDTARSMGYRGDAAGLLDADTNLRYAVKYLRGAYIVAGYSQDGAVRNYQRGYYYDAKRKGLLEEAGLR